MNELKGLSQQEVQERIEQGQVNYTGQSISKTKKEIVRQHTLTYFNFLNIFLAVLIVISGQLQYITHLCHFKYFYGRIRMARLSR